MKITERDIAALKHLKDAVALAVAMAETRQLKACLEFNLSNLERALDLLLQLNSRKEPKWKS